MKVVGKHKGLFHAVLFAAFLCGFFAVQAASPDAIGVRVAPNPKHLSAQRWYVSQGFKGSPQSLTVDGYEAIRDGRTVYIDMANIADDDGSATLSANDRFFTNIFVISYNQDAEKSTEDIFGQILANWNFNNNILTAGLCSDATTVCTYASSCSTGHYCKSSHEIAVRDTKRLADLYELNLLLDDYRKEHGNKCPLIESGSYMPNKSISTWPSWQETLGKILGANLPFDPINKMGPCAGYNPGTCWNESTKRFADPTPADANFDLPAGSLSYLYLSNRTGTDCRFFVTTESNLTCLPGQPDCTVNTGVTDPFAVFSVAPSEYSTTTAATVAPVISCGQLNAFRAAAYQGFVSATDPYNTAFTWTISPVVPPNWAAWAAGGWQWIPGNTGLVLNNSALPNSKRVVAQRAGNPGAYRVRVTAETATASTTKDCNVSIMPTLPTIGASDATVEAGHHLVKTFSGYESGRNYPLAFNFQGALLSGGPVINNFLQCTSTSPVIGEAGGRYNCYVNERIMYPPDVYRVTVSVTDTEGESASASFNLDIVNNPPEINPINCPTSAIMGRFYSCTVSAEDPEENSITLFNVANLPFGITATQSGNQLTFSGTTSAASFGPHNVTISATDEFGLTGSNAIHPLNIINTPPAINPFLCQAAIRAGEAYNCVITATDAEAHAVTFNIPPLPGGLSAVALGTILTISGVPVLAAANPAPYVLQVSATDQFGMTGPFVNWNLKINNYCGDNVVENPNTEGRAGVGNNGSEQCDGPAGLAIGPADSNINRQYACTSNACPLAGDCSGMCQFTDGYCGDGLIQAARGEVCDDGDKDAGDGCTGACQVEFDWVCVGEPSVCCRKGCDTNNDGVNEKICGPDSCGGTCGAGCPAGEACFGGGATCCVLSGAVRTCSDNTHVTYVNGAFVSTASDWGSVQAYNVALQPGKNVLAFVASDWGDLYGTSFTLNVGGGCIMMTTAQRTLWKCTRLGVPATWRDVDYDDSAWPTAVFGNPGSAGIRAGNSLTVPQIWASGAGAGSTVHCRYTFYIQ